MLMGKNPGIEKKGERRPAWQARIRTLRRGRPVIAGLGVQQGEGLKLSGHPTDKR
jgi:hypothetical protein